MDPGTTELMPGVKLRQRAWPPTGVASLSMTGASLYSGVFHQEVRVQGRHFQYLIVRSFGHSFYRNGMIMEGKIGV